MQIAPLDIFFGVLIIVATLRCAVRGFVPEVMSMAALIAGIALAVIFSGRLADLLAQKLGPSGWNKVIAFLLIFLVCYLIIKLLEGLIERAIENVSLGGLDHALGFFLGLAEGLLITAVIVFVLQIQPFFDLGNALHESRIAMIIMNLFPVEPILKGGGLRV